MNPTPLETALTKYSEQDDIPTTLDVDLRKMRDSDCVMLIGPNGERNPSDELADACRAMLAKVTSADDNGYDFQDVETDLENALERYGARR